MNRPRPPDPRNDNAPGGSEASVANQQQRESQKDNTKSRTGRQTYVRLFPERLDFLLAHLTPPQLAAYLRILSEYVVRDGKLSAEDSDMRKVAKLAPGAWTVLRDMLLSYGLGHIANGLWVDADQSRNLEIQKKTSERQRDRILKRWARLRVV